MTYQGISWLTSVGQTVLSQTSQLVTLDALFTGGLEAYDDLNFVLCSATREKYLLCTQKNLRVCPPAGLVSAARILVSEQGDYEFQVLFQTIKKGKLVSVDSFIHLCFKICQLGGYKFCPGLNCGVYNEKYGKVLHRVSKSVKISSVKGWNHPSARDGINWLPIAAFSRGILVMSCANHVRRCAVI